MTLFEMTLTGYDVLVYVKMS